MYLLWGMFHLKFHLISCKNKDKRVDEGEGRRNIESERENVRVQKMRNREETEDSEKSCLKHVMAKIPFH